MRRSGCQTFVTCSVTRSWWGVLICKFFFRLPSLASFWCGKVAVSEGIYFARGFFFLDIFFCVHGFCAQQFVRKNRRHVFWICLRKSWKQTVFVFYWCFPYVCVNVVLFFCFVFCSLSNSNSANIHKAFYFLKKSIINKWNTLCIFFTGFEIGHERKHATFFPPGSRFHYTFHYKESI